MQTPYLISLIMAFCQPVAGAEKASPSFDRDILPVLSDFCFPCHGPDAKSRKGDLRLDKIGRAHV